ncbi:hypothetical protein ACFQPF_15245 [Fictibacillus iocasae]|uniref:Uncharacterized protein n=1 Tax=Fictibacillus iocasae TaxID=2715437 RepID=A0ABW2NR47_9BACL
MKITFPVKFFIAMTLISVLIVFNHHVILNPHPIWEEIEGIAAAFFVFFFIKAINRKGHLNRSFPDAVNVLFITGGVVLPLVILFSTI